MTERPAALAYSTENCTIGRTMAVLGERWTIAVAREVFNGVRRFDDMRVRTDIPRQVLTDRLRTLVDHGILKKMPYQTPGQRQRYEYRMTQKGLDVYPILVAMADWGARYLPNPDGVPLEFGHGGCDAQVHAVLECDEGHRVEDVRDVIPRPGPGAILRESPGEPT